MMATEWVAESLVRKVAASRKTIGAILLTLTVISALVSCDSAAERSVVNENAGSGQPNVVAGPNEKAFDEEYSLRLNLPMPEVEFLDILDGLKLKYEVYGERGTKRAIPTPRYNPTMDLAAIEKCYQIYGDVDRAQGIGKIYRAYVGANHQVIYVENTFAYTGP